MILFAGLFGGFYEFSAMIIAGVLSVILIVLHKKNQTFQIPKSMEFAGILLITLFYVMTILYGVDSGTAVSGVLKMFPVLLFYLYWNNISDREKELIWKQIPMTGTVLTAVAIALYPFETTRELLYRAERLGGTFQYSNTYALFLLIGIIILLYMEQWQTKEKTEMIILILGIAFSGSRSVAILGIIIFIGNVIRKHNYRRILIAVPAFLMAVFMGLFVMKLDLTRLLKLTLNSSTLNGRFLYWQDALPVLWKHPFGLGYMGYYFLQPQIQTGNYVTKFVHNDFLQLGLDAGIMPMIIMIVIVGKTLLSKSVELREKTILTVLVLHSLFDFDLQFVVMTLIGIMCLCNSKTVQVIKKNNKIIIPLLSGAGVVSIYFSLTFGLAYFGKYDQALFLYPYNTFAREERMQSETRISDAEKLIKQNGLLPDTYELRIQKKCENGKTGRITSDIDKMLKNAGYNAEYYDQAVYYLSIALDNAVRSNDVENAQKILKTIQMIPDKIEKKCKNASNLAYKIHDKPEIKLDASIQNYLDKLSNVTLEQN